uniref:Transcription factor domain-containing protein n=1 Tax=Fusarium oxysporum (strain Fo5176) TaxID=660025 RepID=A0A0D2XB86_FUSOF
MTRSFMGLKIDDKGGITYHGPTSLFNLPSDPHKHKPDSISSIDSDAHRRERLVNNAWHQRAMENLSDIPVSPPQIIMDDSAENELWVPFDSPHGSDWKYPPATAHSTSCFMSACRLSVIFNEILIHMYDPLLENTEAEMQECLQTQDPAMRLWWEQLPPHLKIELSAMPELAPPSHIVTMNVYIAATIFLLQVQATPEDQQAVRKLSFCVRALHQAKTVNPGFSTPQQQPPPPMPQPMPDVQMPTDIPITETVYPASFEIPAQQSPYEPEQLFQTPWADNMNPNAMAVDRGVFEALSSFEPLSVRVGAIYESGNNPQNFG